jgi:hypothetical protein
VALDNVKAACRLVARETPTPASRDTLTDKDRDTWIVKCPKCGRVADACKHVSKDDLERVVRLLRAGVEVYESEEDAEDEEALPAGDRGSLYESVDPRFDLEDVVLAPATRRSIDDAILEIRNKRLLFHRWGLEKVVRKKKGLTLLFAGPPGTGKTMSRRPSPGRSGAP